MKKEQFPILGMHCVSCALTIEGALKKVPGVKNASVNFATEKATVEFEDSLASDKLREAVLKTGYKLIVEQNTPFGHGNHSAHKTHGVDGNASAEHDHHRMLKEAEINLLRKKLIIGAVLPFGVVVFSFPDYLPFVGELMLKTLRFFL